MEVEDFYCFSPSRQNYEIHRVLNVRTTVYTRTFLENTRQPTRSLRFSIYGWVALHKQNPFPCKCQRKMIYANYSIRDLYAFFDNNDMMWKYMYRRPADFEDVRLDH